MQTRTSTPAEKAEASTFANKYPRLSKSDRRPDPDFQSKMRAYRERDNEIRNEFAQDLAHEYLGGLSDRIARLVFAKAWDDGRASGYQAVEDEYEELARLCIMAVEETRGQ